MTNEILAWRKHPEPKGTLYNATTLQQPEAVIGLFVTCREATGYINADGWQFLFNRYGFIGLSEIDAVSGWLTNADEGEWISRLVYQSLNAGYNPLDQEKGDYDPDSGKFISLSGQVKRIDWVSIHQLRLADQ